MRNASSSATLVEENYAVRFGVKEATVIRVETGARPAVEKHDRLSVWIPALLVIKLVNVRHSDVAAVIGFDFGIKGSTFLHNGGDYRVRRHCSANRGSDDIHTFRMLVLTKRRLVFATEKSVDTRIEYRFEGEFLRTDFDAVTEKNTPVVRGVLTGSKDGRTLVEHAVRFRFVYVGCLEA